MSNSQVHLGIAMPDQWQSDALAKACHRLSTRRDPASAVLLGPAGLVLVADLPSGLEGLSQALLLVAPELGLVGQAAHVLGVDKVGTTFVVEGSEDWVSTSLVDSLDKALLCELAAKAMGWDYVAGAHLAALSATLPPRLVLNRTAMLGTVLAGHLAWHGPAPTVEQLVAVAETCQAPGEWELMALAAASACLSYGYAAVFSDGELVDMPLTLAAAQAVNLALLELLADPLGQSAPFLAASLARGGLGVLR